MAYIHLFPTLASLANFD